MLNKLCMILICLFSPFVNAELLRVNVVISNNIEIFLPVFKKYDGDVCVTYLTPSFKPHEKEPYDVSSFCDKGVLINGLWQPQSLQSMEYLEDADGLGFHRLSIEVTEMF